MNRLLLLLLLCCCLPLLSFCQGNVQQPRSRVLVFSKTKGFRHGSIGAGKVALLKLAADNGFDADTTEDATAFTADNLKRYQAVVFLSTTGDVFDAAQQAAFEGYIRGGNGYVGIHAATDTEYDWPWYNKLAGAYFDSHPKQQNAVLQVVNNTHPSTNFLPNRWQRYDEWYNFKSLNPDVKVLLKIDETTYEGGKMNNNHPMAWFHNYDGGRAFYTALGHTDASFSEPLFLRHVLAGIQYAMGTERKK